MAVSTPQPITRGEIEKKEKVMFFPPHEIINVDLN
jgi:hypothetical protein